MKKLIWTKFKMAMVYMEPQNQGKQYFVCETGGSKVIVQNVTFVVATICLTWGIIGACVVGDQRNPPTEFGWFRTYGC